MHSRDSDISCLMQRSQAQHECDTTAPDPRRCDLAFSLARQPRRSARVCPGHARWPSLTRLRPPSCPPHLRPEGACHRPLRPLLCVKAHVRAPLHAISQNTIYLHINSLFNIAAKARSTNVSVFMQAGANDCMHSRDSDISCLMQRSQAQHECDTTAPDPRRCDLAFSLARQPRRSARVCPEHARWPSLTRLRPPSCPPHLRPEGACHRPLRPLLCVKAHVRASHAARHRCL
jgi:hypothetical protein